MAGQEDPGGGMPLSGGADAAGQAPQGRAWYNMPGKMYDAGKGLVGRGAQFVGRNMAEGAQQTPQFQQMRAQYDTAMNTVADMQSQLDAIRPLTQGLGNAATGRAANPLQWLLGAAMGNPNAQGWSGLGNFLGTVIPGQHPQMRAFYDQIPGYAGQGWQGLQDLWGQLGDWWGNMPVNQYQAAQGSAEPPLTT